MELKWDKTGAQFVSIQGQDHDYLFDCKLSGISFIKKNILQCMHVSFYMLRISLARFIIFVIACPFSAICTDTQIYE